jgi:GNAT superfamily N-acetyltransferase
MVIPSASPPLIIPLTRALRDEFLAFFEGEAFADNPRWASCYCQFPQEDHREVDWEARSGSENRKLACDRIDAGTMRGYVALVDGQAVGWCSAGPRVGYRFFDDDPVADADEVGSVMCFVVAPAHRGRGVARSLLEAALAGFVERGLTVAEAYPNPQATTDAANHFGPMSLYLSSGFAVQSEDSEGWVVVRKALG